MSAGAPPNSHALPTDNGFAFADAFSAFDDTLQTGETISESTEGAPEGGNTEAPVTHQQPPHPRRPSRRQRSCNIPARFDAHVDLTGKLIGGKSAKGHFTRGLAKGRATGRAVARDINNAGRSSSSNRITANSSFNGTNNNTGSDLFKKRKRSASFDISPDFPLLASESSSLPLPSSLSATEQEGAPTEGREGDPPSHLPPFSPSAGMSVSPRDVDEIMSLIVLGGVGGSGSGGLPGSNDKDHVNSKGNGADSKESSNKSKLGTPPRGARTKKRSLPKPYLSSGEAQRLPGRYRDDWGDNDAVWDYRRNNESDTRWGTGAWLRNLLTTFQQMSLTN